MPNYIIDKKELMEYIQTKTGQDVEQIVKIKILKNGKLDIRWE